MKPSAKRRVEQAVRTIMQADGDHCSLCRAPLQHNTRTFGGVTKDGTPRLVGECCKVKMHEIILMGVFVTRDAGDQPWGKPTGKSHPPADVEGAVTAMQGFFSQRDEEIGALSKRGGIKGAPAGIYREETFWKEDDAAWFEKHPQRSHRLRSLIGDEAEQCGFNALGQMPPRHEIQVVVRQVQPGARIRTPFGRNLAMPIPDEEAVIHALFDVLQAGPQSGNRVIPATTLLPLIAAYSGRGSRPAN